MLEKISFFMSKESMDSRSVNECFLFTASVLAGSFLFQLLWFFLFCFAKIISAKMWLAGIAIFWMSPLVFLACFLLRKLEFLTENTI